MSDEQGSAIDRATLDELLDAVGGDWSFVSELVEAFRTDAPAQVATMREGLDAADAAGVATAAHTLKSSSASLGAARLSAHCARLEAAGRRSELADAEAAVTAIEAALDEALAELDHIVTQA